MESVLEALLTGEIDEYLIAEEGQNLDAVRALKKSSTRDNLLAALKKAKSLDDKARLLMTKEGYRDAANAYGSALKLAVELKSEIDRLPEPSGFWQKVMSYMTPVFDFQFLESEYAGIDAIPVSTRDGLKTQITNRYVIYPDESSKTTKSGVKRSYHLRMNMVIKQCNDKIIKLNYAANSINT